MAESWQCCLEPFAFRQVIDYPSSVDQGLMRYGQSQSRDSIARARPTRDREMTASAPDPAPRRPRVLVVEDEMLIGMLLEDMLADMGHDVVAVVPRVNEALAAVQHESFDVAILDVHLNGQSAFPVAEALIPVDLMLTSQPSACARNAPTVQFSRPPSTENGSYL